jgi:hypothetical protein
LQTNNAGWESNSASQASWQGSSKYIMPEKLVREKQKH